MSFLIILTVTIGRFSFTTFVAPDRQHPWPLGWAQLLWRPCESQNSGDTDALCSLYVNRQSKSKRTMAPQEGENLMHDSQTSTGRLPCHSLLSQMPESTWTTTVTFLQDVLLQIFAPWVTWGPEVHACANRFATSRCLSFQEPQRARLPISASQPRKTKPSYLESLQSFKSSLFALAPCSVPQPLV